MTDISAKSQLAQAPVLFNAGADTQLLFNMRGMSDASMEAFNTLTDARGKRRWSACVRLIANKDIDPVFVGCKQKTLEHNLLYIRETMADVLAWMYRERLLIDSGCKDVAKLCERMKEQDPLDYKIPGLYEKVVKDFLVAAFFGMTGSRPWDGKEQTNAGCFAALPHAEPLCQYASNREQLRDYLFQNTYIDYVSCEENQWGFAYKDERERYLLPVNAAVRFLPTKASG